MKKFTHAGVLKRCSAACMGKDHWVKLREAPNWWTTEYGDKYRKQSGWRMGEKWPHWSLNVATIIPIAEFEARVAAKKAAGGTTPPPQENHES